MMKAARAPRRVVAREHDQLSHCYCDAARDHDNIASGGQGAKMRVHFALAAFLTLASGALAEDFGRPTAILVSPIHEAQVVRGDDGMDHVEYELLVVSVFSEPITLSSVTVLDPAGKELKPIEGDTLTAATQTVFARTQTAVIPASAVVSVDVDLILPPDTAPERVTHRIAYTLKGGLRTCFDGRQS